MKKSLFALIALIIAISFIFSGCSLINKFFKKDDNSKTPTETYSLVFNTNGGTEIATQTYKSGTILKETDLETSRKVGYNLIGWYYDSDCTEKVNFPLKITKDATIYAKWEIKKPDVGEYVTLTYYGGGSKRSIKFLKGTVLEEDFIKPSDGKRIFDSWYFDYKLTNKVIIIGSILRINNKYNYYGDEILEEYYDKYLQEYYYMGLSKEDADFVFGTLRGQLPLNHHSKELNTYEIFEKIKNELILNEDAPYRIVYFDK